MNNSYYEDSIENFLNCAPATILGKLSENSGFDISITQRDAWSEEVRILKNELQGISGLIYFEYVIPRFGKRIDVLVITDRAIFVFEFKVGASSFNTSDRDQVWDYALDLKNFHSNSHDCAIIPVVVATHAELSIVALSQNMYDDQVFFPIFVGSNNLREIFNMTSVFMSENTLDYMKWSHGYYSPTPTIVEAARALYRGHSVENISRSDAGVTNITKTTKIVSEIIEQSRKNKRKSICFVTGVPGAGKTLVGLDIAHKHLDRHSELYSVYLSGNGPLVSILREALSRDKVAHEKERSVRVTKKDAYRDVSLFIQNVHHFRDDCLRSERAPVEHVVVFDEAQRAWNKEKTVDFMRRKRGQMNFSQSEPEFLISCLDRHHDWATVVCLVGGGQEIHNGEGGIAEWISSVFNMFPDWDIYLSSQLSSAEYRATEMINMRNHKNKVVFQDSLHLSASMRSFRSEKVSLFVKQLLDVDVRDAQSTLVEVKKTYPIVLTRNIGKAKKWLKERARGNERYGMIVSSQAERLRPHAIFVKSTIDPVHWFLDGRDDVRSSYYLEDVATEFDIQGLELDWSCVVWDGDYRYSEEGWVNKSFTGNQWKKILKEDRKKYQKNAYRVLLTRARQGMVIVVPEGDIEDPTRHPEIYDSTYEYLKSVGIEEI